MNGVAQDRRLPTTRRIFLSASDPTLSPHWEQARDMVGRLDHLPVTREPGGPASGDPPPFSAGRVASCEVYLGLVGWRYGVVPSGETRSLIHLEYMEARQFGLPRFLFLAAAEFAPPAAEAGQADQQAALLAFRADLAREERVAFFTTPDDLAKQMGATLNEYLLRKDQEERQNRPRPPRRLPRPPAGFVGREQELQAIEEALRVASATVPTSQRPAPSVALIGLGGVGKSGLAAQAINRLAADPAAFPGGVTWVACDERQGFVGLVWVYDQLLAAWNSSLTPEELGRATTTEAELDLRERVLRTRLRGFVASATVPTPPAPVGTVADAIPYLPALVLLDNVERDLPLHRALETLSALNIAVLLTMRNEPASPRLRLIQLDVLEPLPAIQLFARHYSDRGGAWDSERDGPPAANVVEALGRLPLAILLAAARAARQHLSVGALAEELAQPGLLARLKDPVKRSASITYSFEKSLTLLTPAQRTRFVALGLPDGPDWPRPVIEPMLGAVPPADSEASPPEDDLDLLAALSLVNLLAPEPPTEQEESARLAAPRVRLHPLLRELAREEWAGVPAEIQTLALGSLLDAIGGLILEDTRDFATLEREEALIVGAIRRAARQHIRLPELNNIIQMLFEYVQFGGHWRLGLELFTLQRNARHDLGDRPGEGATLIKLGGLASALGRSEQAQWTFEIAASLLDGEENQAMRAYALSTLAEVHSGQGNKEAARRAHQQALALHQQAGNQMSEALAYGSLAGLALAEGHPDEAGQRYRQALAAARQIADGQQRGTALNNLGGIARLLGQPDEAGRCFEQALPLLRAARDRQGEGATLNNLGELAQLRGQPDAAARSFLAALALARQGRNRSLEGDALDNLGTLARGQGHYQEAAGYYQQALMLAREVGNRRREHGMLRHQGQLAQATGDLAVAQGAYEQAVEIEQEMGERPQEAVTLILLGRLAHESGQLEAAYTYFERALAIEREVGEPAGMMTDLAYLGTLAQALGRLEEGLHFSEEALGLAVMLGDVQSSVACLINLGMLSQELRRWDAANHYLKQALALQRGRGDQAGAALALGLLGMVAREAGRLEDAVGLYQQQLEIAEAMQDQARTTEVLKMLGTLNQMLKRPDAALTYFEEALPRLRAAGEQEQEALILTRMGLLVKSLGRWDEAAGLLKRARAIEQAAGRKRNEGIVLLQMGNLAKEQGQLEAAAGAYHEALDIFQELDDTALTGQAQEKLAALDAS